MIKNLFIILSVLILLVAPVYAYSISGFIKDSDTVLPINGAVVDIEDLGGSLIDSGVTGSNGFYDITIPDVPGVYVAKASATGYLEQSKPFFNDQDIVNFDFSLKFTGGISSCTDNDGDGYGAQGTDLSQCPGSTTVEDCDDGNGSVYPGAPEVCDSVDNQCSGDSGYGQIDEGCGNGGGGGGGSGSGGGGSSKCVFNIYDINEENEIVTRDGCYGSFDIGDVRYKLSIKSLTVNNLTAELSDYYDSVVLDTDTIDLGKSGRLGFDNLNDILIKYNELKFGSVNLTILMVDKLVESIIVDEGEETVNEVVEEKVVPKKTSGLIGAAVADVKGNKNLTGLFVMLGIVVIVIIVYFLVRRVFKG